MMFDGATPIRWPIASKDGRLGAMSQVVHIDPEILGGTPVFIGTRVPALILFEYLQHGYTIGYFLEQFPSVQPEQVQTALDEALAKILAGS
jgi:uncharacterized protein (DUF433 family)